MSSSKSTLPLSALRTLKRCVWGGFGKQRGLVGSVKGVGVKAYEILVHDPGVGGMGDCVQIHPGVYSHVSTWGDGDA